MDSRELKARQFTLELFSIEGAFTGIRATDVCHLVMNTT